MLPLFVVPCFVIKRFITRFLEIIAGDAGVFMMFTLNNEFRRHNADFSNSRFEWRNAKLPIISAGRITETL